MQALPSSSDTSARASKRHSYTGSVSTAELPSGPTTNPAAAKKTTPVPIRPSTIRALLELGCDQRDQKLGLAFLDRFQKAHWGDSKTIVGVTQVGGCRGRLGGLGGEDSRCVLDDAFWLLARMPIRSFRPLKAAGEDSFLAGKIKSRYLG